MMHCHSNLLLGKVHSVVANRPSNAEIKLTGVCPPGLFLRLITKGLIYQVSLISR